MAAGTGSDSATHVIGDADRLPRGSPAMVWWSLCSAMFYLFLGAALAVQYGTRNALFGAALGIVSHGVLGFLFTRHAVRTGASCFLVSRVLFGRVGATLTSVVFFLTATYYAAFESAIVGAVMLSPNILQYILIALSYQAIVLISWVGVALAHLTLSDPDAHEAVARSATDARAFEPAGLVAWGASAIVGYALLEQEGLAAALSVPASFVVAIAGYRLLCTPRLPAADAAT